MGAVYEGTQEGLGRPVAIKVLKSSAGHGQGQISSAQLERFGREARSAAALGHPNIVQVTDFQPTSDPPFLVMERLTGESLRDAIARDKRLPTARVALIGTQLLDALGAAHAAGIVHRDVKPDNVFLTRMVGMADLVKVLDFGIAKLESERPLTAAGARMGSPAYMSPEQAAGRPADHRTDIFCVGATLYHALAGRLPFDTQSLAELLVWIAERPPVPLAERVPGIDPRMIAVLDRAMEKDPARRFQSAGEMQSALAPLLASAPTLPAWPLAPPAPAAAPHGSPPPVNLAYGPPHNPVYGSSPGGPHAAGAPGQLASPQVPPRPPAAPRARGHALLALGMFGILAICATVFALGRLAQEDAATHAPPAPPKTAPRTTPPAQVAPSAPPPAAHVATGWAKKVATTGAVCSAGRYAPYGSRPWRVAPPEVQTGLGSQLAYAVEDCDQRCPGVPDVAVYVVRIYGDGEVVEAKIAPGTPSCPARDNCVDEDIREASIDGPDDEEEIEIELSCTFKRAPRSPGH